MTAFIVSKRQDGTAFQMGKIAYGKYTNNPFALGTVEFTSWEQGFLSSFNDDVKDTIETGHSEFNVPVDQDFNPMTVH